MEASSAQFKTMTETEVLRRQNSLLIKICAAIAIVAMLSTVGIVYIIQQDHVKITRAAINGVLKGVKQCLPKGS